MAFQRGLDESQELDQRKIIRDTRPLSMRIADFFKDPRHVAYTCICFALATLFLGYLSEIFMFIGIGTFIYCFARKTKLPFRMPMHSHRDDYNDLKPGNNKPNKAGGIYYFGNEIKTNDELWFNDTDMRTHVLIFGSTGSGKTEAMISLAYNALLQASGFIYIDGKGDNTLFSKVFSMVRSMGREDDMLLINFMTGARDVIGPQETRLSNTLNPFARGSSSMLAQLVVSLMDNAASTPDGDMWKGRAIGFVEALMKILVAMRDAGHILLDANTVRNYFHLSRIEAMVIDKLFLRDGQEAISLEGMPPTILEPIINYANNLPGFQKDKKGKQGNQTHEQHGFITMQLTRAFTSLADTYGHIMRTKLAEVDLTDVVLNRRILCVLLPALEKSPDELSNLGKVIIATLKAMMAAGLGDQVEGDYDKLVNSKPTNAKSPYLCILDEYGYYAVEGFAVVPAQARSLGFSVVFAGQDLPAFQKASKEEAASIGANTNIKICMKLEDPTETWDFFMKSAGESYVSHVESFQVDQGSVLGNYNDAKGARLEKRARVDLLDLKEQGLGEAHIFFKSKIVRARMFYADPKVTTRMRLNHFLKVDYPEDDDVKKLQKSFQYFGNLTTDSINLNVEASNEEINKVVTAFTDYQGLQPIDRSLMALHQFEKKVDVPFFEDETPLTFDSFEPEIDHLSVFMPVKINPHLQQVMKASDKDGFTNALLSRADARDHIEYIQRMCGDSSQKSMNVAIEMIGDMEKGTRYPPDILPKGTGPELAATVENMIDSITLKKKEDENKDDNK